MSGRLSRPWLDFLPHCFYGKRFLRRLMRKPRMRPLFLLWLFTFLNCAGDPLPPSTNASTSPKIVQNRKFDADSWPYFLQHLPVVDSPILDFEGRPVPYQQKHVGII